VLITQQFWLCLGGTPVSSIARIFGAILNICFDNMRGNSLAASVFQRTRSWVSAYIAEQVGVESSEDCRTSNKARKEFAVAPQPSIAASAGSGPLSKAQP
jgi:hypothetical protein